MRLLWLVRCGWCRSTVACISAIGPTPWFSRSTYHQQQSTSTQVHVHHVWNSWAKLPCCRIFQASTPEYVTYSAFQATASSLLFDFSAISTCLIAMIMLWLMELPQWETILTLLNTVSADCFVLIPIRRNYSAAAWQKYPGFDLVHVRFTREGAVDIDTQCTYDMN